MSNLRIISSNIRYENPKDGDHDWPNRREYLAECLNRFDAHLIGTQEGREDQLRDLEKLLPNLKMVDSHRRWIEKRMYPCLFFNLDELTCHESGDLWLSETPHKIGSSSFESAFPRLVTWGIFSFKDFPEKTFLVANTHLDHVLDSTRIEQAKVLCQELKILAKKKPLILMGDFNTEPTSEVRKIIFSSFPQLKDPWEEKNLPEISSHHPFTGENPKGARIDWILCPKEFKCDEIRFDQSKSDKGIYPSDHFPLLAAMEWPN